MAPYTIGVDIGGTKIKIVAMDRESLNLFHEDIFPTEAGRGYRAVLDDIIAKIQNFFETYPKADCIGIGVGSPGPINIQTGYVESPPNLKWVHEPIVADLKVALDCPCYLANDADLAALGEYQFGLKGEAKTMVYITVSTGIGAGIIKDGKIYQGTYGNAGELGHSIIKPFGVQCACGKKGCLEAYSSGTAISNRACEEFGLKLSAKDVADRAAAGDERSQAILDDAFFYLGVGISNIIKLFDPDVIVLGGGVSLLGDRLLKPVRKTVVETDPELGHVKIITAIMGHDSGAYGAAYYPLTMN